jgi:branched-chain amino acid transport system permease protein
MDFSIASILMLDGATNGAVYGLLGLVIVLVFSVTRIIFIPQGEFVAYAALSLAVMQMGKVPGTIWLLLILAVVASLMNAIEAQRHGQNASQILKTFLKTIAPSLLVSALTIWASPLHLPLLIQALICVLIVTCFGPLVYRVAFQSLEDASSLVLLIVSVAVHLAMTGLGLLFFGAEGYRNPPFWSDSFELSPLRFSGQTILIFALSLSLIFALWIYFEKTLTGKALRATAINRTGVRLMGISSRKSGNICFTLAALICAVSGLLIGPTTTIFYDSGFLIGLKGFVAAIIAGLTSYPGAMLSAIVVGIIESFGSFWASNFKEVIVFTLIIPVLLWRSIKAGSHEES